MRICAWIASLLVGGLEGPGLAAQPPQARTDDPAQVPKAIIIIGCLKHFGTRNWRPSVYVDDTELGCSQNGRYLVAKVDAGKRTVRAEDPKYALQMERKAGECYCLRVEIASVSRRRMGAW